MFSLILKAELTPNYWVLIIQCCFWFQLGNTGLFSGSFMYKFLYTKFSIEYNYLYVYIL